MQIYLSQDNSPIGPFVFEDVRLRVAGGLVTRTDLGWYEGCPGWIPLGTIPGLFPSPPPLPSHAFPRLTGEVNFTADGVAAEEVFLRRMSDYEKVSGILWIGLAAVQIVSLVGIVAGVWNVFAAISRLGISKRILQRNPEIPKDYEGITQLIVIAAINLFLGGVIGIVFVAFDFYIRDLVLRNVHLFKPAEATPDVIPFEEKPMISS